MKYAAHSLMWTLEFTEESLDLFDKLKGMGFDGLEVNTNWLKTLPANRIREKMSETGMECVCTAVLDKETNIISPDKKKRKAGVQFLKERVDIASELGSDVLGGVTYAGWGELTGEMRTKEEWARSKECLLEVAQYAQKKGVVLALEPINRYETHFLNTAEDARKLVEEIDHPNVRIHLDTYHLNIEEESFYDAVKIAGEYLYHLHVCENNRGIPGTGHVAWSDIFRALKELQYDRWAVIESFVPAIEEVARVTAIWRHIAPSADAIAGEGLKFLKSKEREASARGPGG